ncbi:MAG: right-handed parallel beta-helix repeat-containing protein, partial [Acidimicrobiales bacterium]
GTQNATLSGLTITGTYGDGITLNPLRSSADHKGSGILSATDNVTINDISVTDAGRMGIAFVSVDGASVSDIDITNVGLDTFDVESDQGNEGSQDVTINGCTASSTGAGDFFADGGAGSGKSTGSITVENCTMTEAQAGTVIWVNRPTNGIVPRGPYLFENDTFDCGSSTTVACVIVNGATVTVQDSSLSFPGTIPAETVYSAADGTTLDFTEDDVSGYGTTSTDGPGTVDSTSTVTVAGGTWTPAG